MTTLKNPLGELTTYRYKVTLNIEARDEDSAKRKLNWLMSAVEALEDQHRGNFFEVTYLGGNALHGGIQIEVNEK